MPKDPIVEGQRCLIQKAFSKILIKLIDKWNFGFDEDPHYKTPKEESSNKVFRIADFEFRFDRKLGVN